ncbi:MAG TPA: DUF6644 family protein [Cellvibrionaceae bacterium]
MIRELLQYFYSSQWGEGLRESLYVYPLVEGVHLLSLSISFGFIALIDLRLLNILFRSVPIAVLLPQLRLWMLSGFAVTFVTGFLLTMAEGPMLLDIFVFPLKMLAIFIAAINALWFEYSYGRHINTWSARPSYPFGVKLSGAISLFTWTSVIILGRLIPYLDGVH